MKGEGLLRASVLMKSLPIATLLRAADVVEVEPQSHLTLRFPPGTEFHRAQLRYPASIAILQDALAETYGGTPESYTVYLHEEPDRRSPA
jgi:hypothetical protein